MPRPRFLRLPPERRRAILDAAARRFARDGFAGASLNQILEDAGVSKGAAYYYFEDKGDLFATVVEEAWAQVEAELLPAGGFDPARLEGEGFWPELARIYRRHLEMFEERPDIWRVTKVAQGALGDPSAARLAPKLAALMESLTRLLEAGQRAGQVRDDLPVDLLLAMLSGLDGAIDQWLLEHPGALRADPELAGRTFGALQALIEPRGAR